MTKKIEQNHSWALSLSVYVCQIVYFEYWKSLWCLVCFTSPIHHRLRLGTTYYNNRNIHIHISYLSQRMLKELQIKRAKKRSISTNYCILVYTYTYLHALLTITKWTKLLSLTPMRVYSAKKKQEHQQQQHYQVPRFSNMHLGFLAIRIQLIGSTYCQTENICNVIKKTSSKECECKCGTKKAPPIVI